MMPTPAHVLFLVVSSVHLALTSGCSLTGDTCTSGTYFSNKNALTPIQDGQYGTIDLGDSLYISFDLVLHSGFSGSYQSILHIGHVNTDRWPAIFLKNNANKIHSRLGDNIASNMVYNIRDDLSLDTPYNYKLIAQNDGTVEVYLNDVLKVSRSDRFLVPRDDAPLYLSSPWHTPVDATITNLIIQPCGCSTPTVAPTASPTFPTALPTTTSSLPTLSPTVEKIESSTCSITGDTCTSGAYFQHNKPGLTLIQDTQHGTINTGDSLYISFDVVFHSDFSGKRNILHIGHENTDQWPAIYLKEADGVYTFIVRLADEEADGSEVRRYYGFAFSMSINTMYNIKLTAENDGKVKIYVDDVLKTSKSNKFIVPRTDAPIYLSNPWNTAADATITNLVIQPCGCSVPSPSPTQAPTRAWDTVEYHWDLVIDILDSP